MKPESIHKSTSTAELGNVRNDRENVNEDICEIDSFVPKLNVNHANSDINAGYYLHAKTLGEGLFGKVRLATHLQTFQHVAVNVINKKRFRNDHDRKMVDTEINCLKVLKHPNIARLLQLIECEDQIYVVREYCGNGDLYDYVDKRGKLTEMESKRIMFDLFNCLSYIHERGFSHRDIRPENILLDSKFSIKLIGFRFAHIRFDSSQFDLASLKTQYLSPEYVPPEVIISGGGGAGHKIYSPAIDVWSSGIVLHFMLTGTLPFADDNLARLFKKIECGVVRFPRDLNHQVCDLLTQMLTVDPLKRINVKQVLSHAWLHSDAGGDATLTSTGKIERIPIETTFCNDIDDKLDENALTECFQLNLDLVQDIIELRYNIRYQFCYQTATYWLIKENYQQFKKLVSKGHSNMFGKYSTGQFDPSSSRFRSQKVLVNHSRTGKAALGVMGGSKLSRRHTLLESRVIGVNCAKIGAIRARKHGAKVPSNSVTSSNGANLRYESDICLPRQITGTEQRNSRKCHQSIATDSNGAQQSINRSELEQIEQENSANNERDTRCMAHTGDNGVSEPCPPQVTDRKTFKFGRIFSKSNLLERSNSTKSINQTNNHDLDESCWTETSLNECVKAKKKTGSSLKKSLSRKVSFVGITNKLFGKNQSRANINVKASSSSSSSLLGNRFKGNSVTNLSTVNNDKLNGSARCSCDEEEDDCTVVKDCDSNPTVSGDGSDAGTVSMATISATEDEDNDDVSAENKKHSDNNNTNSKKTVTKTKKQTIRQRSAARLVSKSKLNDYQVPMNKSTSFATSTTGATSTTVAIITRYNNSDECLNDATQLLTNKGINCKREKHKLRCCISAMNVVIVAFQLEFLTFPALNQSQFVMIKVKHLRGNMEDFHLICGDLTKYFERK